MHNEFKLGRTIAGIILEQMMQAKNKSVWISVSSDLNLDAKRDLADVGVMSDFPVKTLSEVSILFKPNSFYFFQILSACIFNLLFFVVRTQSLTTDQSKCPKACCSRPTLHLYQRSRNQSGTSIHAALTKLLTGLVANNSMVSLCSTSRTKQKI